MITWRQIDRLWSAKAYDRLLGQLLSPRPEGSPQLLEQLTGPLPAAAMAVIRLDELAHPLVPLYSELIRILLVAQRPDGSWGDVMTTTLCLRALLCGNGGGPAIEQGLQNLAALQKPEGIWPNVPLLRMPIDPFASAFVLCRLGDLPRFRQAVDLQAAFDWFESNDTVLDEQTRRLWSHARRRQPAGVCAARQPSIVPSPSVGFWDFRAALGT